MIIFHCIKILIGTNRPLDEPSVRRNVRGTNRPGTNRPGTNRPGTNRPGTNRPDTIYKINLLSFQLIPSSCSPLFHPPLHDNVHI